jgi:Niemann-Pick C2 protein
MLILISVLVLASVGQSFAESVNFTDCGPGNIKDVRISPCPVYPCVLKLDSNVTVEADFEAPFSTSALTETIKGVVRGRELPFPEQRKDPCTTGHLQPGCPVKQGRIYQYKATFEIKPFYPPISIKVKYGLSDPTGKTVACVQVAAKIIDPNPPKSSTRTRGSSRPKSNRQSRRQQS